MVRVSKGEGDRETERDETERETEKEKERQRQRDIHTTHAEQREMTERVVGRSKLLEMKREPQTPRHQIEKRNRSFEKFLY